MQDKDRKRHDAQDAGDRLVARHVREDPFAAAFKATRMPMIVTDPNQDDNPIIFCNAAFEKLTGYSSDEVVGRNCRFLQGPETSRTAVARIREAVAAGSDIAIDILNYRKDGASFWNALFLSPVRDDAGKIVSPSPSVFEGLSWMECCRRVRRHVLSGSPAHSRTLKCSASRAGQDTGSRQRPCSAMLSQRCSLIPL